MKYYMNVIQIQMLSIILKFAKTTSIEAQILREGAGVALQKKDLLTGQHEYGSKLLHWL